MGLSKRLTLLHLSDLQFGEKHGYAAGTSAGSLAERLSQSLAQLRETDGVQPDLLVLSGDLAELGKHEELQQVRTFVEALARHLSLPLARVVVVPGNHDINRNLCLSYFLECKESADGAEPVLPYWPKYKHYAHFFSQIYGEHRPASFTTQEPFSFYEYPDLGVAVAGLNSTIADSHQEDTHYGYLGEDQIRAFVGKLRPAGEKGYLRIGVVHHDPTRSEGHDGIHDADLLKRTLAPHLDLLLHGHTHEDAQQWWGDLPSGPLPVLGIGSAGIGRDGRPHEIGNQFQLLHISQHSIEVALYRYDAQRRDWIGDTRADPEGKSPFTSSPVPRFARATAAFAPEATSQPSRDAMADAIAHYRRVIAEVYRGRHFAEESGLLPRLGVHEHADLLRLFVMPKVEMQAFVAPRRALPTEERAEERPRMEWHPPLPADDVLFDDSPRWLLFLGGPGAGKSALTSWLMRKLCAPGEAAESLSALVPVRIEMRRFAQRLREHHAQEPTFYDYLEAESADLSIDGLRAEKLKELASAGRLWWIFDGLDEITDEALRTRCAEMIGALKQRVGGRGLMTSRELGSEAACDVLRRFGVSIGRLRDFDPAQVNAFLHAFPLPEPRRERLFATLHRSASIEEMSRTPLMLTMITLLSLRSDVPERRRALYARLVELLVEEWESQKETESGDAARFDYGRKTEFLSKLALKMMRDDKGGAGNVIEDAELMAFAIGYCQTALGERELVAKRTARHFLDKLRIRNGVLVHWGASTNGFVHRAFLDFLAAEELQEGIASEQGLGLVETLVDEHWASPAWRECLSMALGAIAERDAGKAIAILRRTLRDKKKVRLLEAELARYVGFCIYAIADLGKALQAEPLRTFAVRLTEMIRICGAGGEYPDGTSDLTRAFQNADFSWPGAELLRAWALDHARLIFSAGAQMPTAEAALLVTDPREHLAFISEFLSRPSHRVGIAFVVRASCRMKAWSEAEVVPILEMAKGWGERALLGVVCVFLEFGLATATLVTALFELMRHATDEDVRIDAALFLMSVSKDSAATLATVVEETMSLTLDLLEKHAEDDVWRFEPRYAPTLADTLRSVNEKEPSPSYRRLRDWLHSDREPLRLLAAAVFAYLEDAEAISTLVDLLKGGEELKSNFALNVLEGIPSAHLKAAASLLARIDEVHEIALQSALSWFIQYGDPGLIEDTVNRVFQSNHTVWTKLWLAEWLQRLSIVTRLCTAFVLDTLRSSHDERAVTRAWHTLGSGDFPLLPEQWQELLTRANELHTDPWPRFYVGSGLLRGANIDPALQRRGEALLVDLTKPDIDENIRISAAIALRDHGILLGQDTLLDLAHSAQSEHSRAFAARQILDLDTLRSLADAASVENVRNDAAQFLALLDARDALLRVGRARRGIVSLSGERVGIIEETPTGSRFTYDAAYVQKPSAKAISLTMPVRALPYESDGLHPVFENLLPEGWLLQIARKTLGPKAHDPFGLLLATCGDCIGAIEVVPEPEEADA